MRADELKEDVAGELEHMSLIVQELVALESDVSARNPTLREKVAAAGFLSQFYNGIENILKRISKYENVPQPEGESWHVELFERFSAGADDTGNRSLPMLFDQVLARDLAAYRGFRHVMRIAYGVELKWNLMREGIARIDKVFERFKNAVQTYLGQLDGTR